MKFVTDSMLGKITRWLRILGYNVKYSNKINDEKLVAVAKKERRVLLTRDLQLYRKTKKQNLDAMYIRGKTIEEKLAEIAKCFKLKLDVTIELSRCP